MARQFSLVLLVSPFKKLYPSFGLFSKEDRSLLLDLSLFFPTFFIAELHTGHRRQHARWIGAGFQVGALYYAVPTSHGSDRVLGTHAAKACASSIMSENKLSTALSSYCVKSRAPLAVSPRTSSLRSFLSVTRFITLRSIEPLLIK